MGVRFDQTFRETISEFQTGIEPATFRWPVRPFDHSGTKTAVAHRQHICWTYTFARYLDLGNLVVGSFLWSLEGCWSCGGVMIAFSLRICFSMIKWPLWSSEFAFGSTLNELNERLHCHKANLRVRFSVSRLSSRCVQFPLNSPRSSISSYDLLKFVLSAIDS